MVRWVLMGALLAGAASCATGSGMDPDMEFPEDDAGFVEDTGEPEDAGFVEDTGSVEDTGEPKDSGTPDAGAEDVGVDAGSVDVATPDAGAPDAGLDAGPRDTGAVDTGTPDAGTPDTGPRDTGVVDAGTPDTGPRDTGVVDVGTPDVGTPDAGTPDAGTPDVGTPDVPSCVPRTETFNGRDDDCDGLVDEGFTRDGLSLACMGTGRIILFSDGEVDDGGGSSGGDGLEVFCINGSARFCLTGEACPWRAGAPAVDDGRSCSNAGLNPRTWFMAYLTRGYIRIDGYQLDLFYCPADGRVLIDLN